MMIRLQSPLVLSISLQAFVVGGLHGFRAGTRLGLPLLLSLGALLAQITNANTDALDDGVAVNTSPKTLFVIVDGIPADVIERVNTPGIDAVTKGGSYLRAFVGGELVDSHRQRIEVGWPKHQGHRQLLRHIHEDQQAGREQAATKQGQMDPEETAGRSRAQGSSRIVEIPVQAREPRLHEGEAHRQEPGLVADQHRDHRTSEDQPRSAATLEDPAPEIIDPVIQPSQWNQKS